MFLIECTGVSKRICLPATSNTSKKHQAALLHQGTSVFAYVVRHIQLSSHFLFCPLPFSSFLFPCPEKQCIFTTGNTESCSYQTLTVPHLLLTPQAASSPPVCHVPAFIPILHEVCWVPLCCRKTGFWKLGWLPEAVAQTSLVLGLLYRNWQNWQLLGRKKKK